MPDSDATTASLVREAGEVRGRIIPNEYMLTTYDNPFDPFDQFEEWFVWDMNAGYNTCGLLSLVARSSGELSEADQYVAVQAAIDEIVRENVSGVHKKVKRGDPVTVT